MHWGKKKTTLILELVLLSSSKKKITLNYRINPRATLLELQKSLYRMSTWSPVGELEMANSRILQFAR